MKGFSLLEAVISLAIGLVIFAGLLEFATRNTRRMAIDRGRIGAEARLNMARDDLWRLTRTLEPDFWLRFQLQSGLIHPESLAGRGVSFSHSCAQHSASACAVLWDIVPADEEPVVYMIDDHTDYPGSLAISPIPKSYPVGPSRAIKPMSVLLFIGPAGSFCLLVNDVRAREVYFAGPSDAPWAIPEALEEGPYEIVHLGYLRVTHCGLLPDDQGLAKLSFQPWVNDENGWRPKRRSTSQSGLIRMIWLPGMAPSPDRLVLFARDVNAPEMAQPITIAGQTFQKEVHCVALAF